MNFNINSINPYIRVAMPSVLPKGTVIKQRVIFDYELIYIEENEFVLKHNGKNYKCLPGQFIFIRPGIPHAFTKIRNDLSQPHIHFDMVYSSKSAETPVSFKDTDNMNSYELSLLQKDIFEKYENTPFVTFSNKEAVLKLFYEIVTNNNISKLAQKANLLQIIEMLINDNFPNFHFEENTHTIANQLKNYIDAGQGLSSTLTDFEKQFFFSKYHLEREFKKEYGISVIAYRNNKRMEYAKKMLETENVSSVSNILGFSSVYVFSRAFKQCFGFSPSNIQKNRN